jgi:ribosome biogenesis SPOUT family RNA methylase Rps3
MASGKIYVVEHLDPELEAWSALEYASIAAESQAAGATFYISSVPSGLSLPPELQGASGLQVESRGVEELFEDRKAEVCLLDPAAEKELSPEDASKFGVFLFGGILGRDYLWP